MREKGGLCLIAFQMFLVALGVITHNTEVWEDTPKSKKGKQKSSGSSSLNALYLTAIGASRTLALPLLTKDDRSDRNRQRCRCLLPAWLSDKS